jgi:ankyrin repeat protein
LSRGADPLTKTDSGMTSFHLIPEVLDPRILISLIECGIDVNSKDQRGNTPLMYAVMNQQIHVIKFLLTEGARINEVNNEGESAIFISAKQGCPETFELLYKHGARLNIVNKDSKSLEEICRRHSTRYLLRMIQN